MSKNARSYLAEFLGTFMLVFIGTAVAVLSGMTGSADANAQWLRISFAFGGTLTVLVWVIGPVSGCHLNPAVTLPMALSKRMPMALVPGYLAAQVAGGIVASFALQALLEGVPGYAADKGLGANDVQNGMAPAVMLAWEALMTALFLFTIFAATRADGTPGLHAFAIGGFLFVSHLVGAQLGDSSLNPARSFGPALLTGGSALSNVWVFVVGPLVGGLAGWQLYKLTYDD